MSETTNFFDHMFIENDDPTVSGALGVEKRLRLRKEYADVICLEVFPVLKGSVQWLDNKRPPFMVFGDRDYDTSLDSTKSGYLVQMMTSQAHPGCGEREEMDQIRLACYQENRHNYEVLKGILNGKDPRLPRK